MFSFYHCQDAAPISAPARKQPLRGTRSQSYTVAPYNEVTRHVSQWLRHLEIVVAATDEHMKRKFATECRYNLLQRANAHVASSLTSAYVG